ncbi:sigma-70 family RNA polymerase sigma factor [Acetobacterium malicum]|uniref:Sigma-70 family RNA polymerase sigma factor n=2 Tax=Acetobacterium malicum TaxID=52692 RepID=A0ABR6YVX3_9FIRM|nr:sigma-70 family RNA polymerase sigma factor [Acetobacterium malicum]
MIERGDNMENNEMILLVRGARQRDTRCQLALIEGFRPLMLSMIRRYIYEMDAVDDYLSEAAIVLLNAVETFNEDLGVPFSGYLKKELFYYFVNVAKVHQNFYSLDSSARDEDSFSLLNSLADATDIEGDYLRAADLSALQQYLPRLRERQRWIIEEHYGKNRSFREIAGSIGVSANSLVKLHRRAIADLRTYFGLELVN